MGESENLGRLSAWQVRDFPEELRRQIADQARREDMTVGEFLTRCMVLLRDAGWPRAGNDPSNTFANTSTAVAIRGGQHVPPGHTELRELAQMARDLTPPDKDTAVLREARAVVRARIKALRTE